MNIERALYFSIVVLTWSRKNEVKTLDLVDSKYIPSTGIYI